ncbi:MAG: hypothetical protein JWM43_3201 [Acidobacteriaceae bacterium]|nr:hypothetical protein [Acidobacteriaceae bacterium]
MSIRCTLPLFAAQHWNRSAAPVRVESGDRVRNEDTMETRSGVRELTHYCVRISTSQMSQRRSYRGQCHRSDRGSHSRSPSFNTKGRESRERSLWEISVALCSSWRCRSYSGGSRLSVENAAGHNSRRPSESSTRPVGPRCCSNRHSSQRQFGRRRFRSWRRNDCIKHGRCATAPG